MCNNLIRPLARMQLIKPHEVIQARLRPYAVTPIGIAKLIHTIDICWCGQVSFGEVVDIGHQAIDIEYGEFSSRISLCDELFERRTILEHIVDKLCVLLDLVAWLCDVCRLERVNFGLPLNLDMNIPCLPSTCSSSNHLTEVCHTMVPTPRVHC